MDDLDEFLDMLRKENNARKQEIIKHLNQLIQVHDDADSLPDTGVSTSSYKTEQCNYLQKLHHKLIELDFEVKKFSVLNKPPICKPVIHKTSDVDPVDYEYLKVNSMSVIKKFDERLTKDGKNLQTSHSDDISVKPLDSTDKVGFPYMSKGTLEQLSDHTKVMLQDLSDVSKCSQGDEIACSKITSFSDVGPKGKGNTEDLLKTLPCLENVSLSVVKGTESGTLIGNINNKDLDTSLSSIDQFSSELVSRFIKCEIEDPVLELSNIQENVSELISIEAISPVKYHGHFLDIENNSSNACKDLPERPQSLKILSEKSPEIPQLNHDETVLNQENDDHLAYSEYPKVEGSKLISKPTDEGDKCYENLLEYSNSTGTKVLNETSPVENRIEGKHEIENLVKVGNLVDLGECTPIIALENSNYLEIFKENNPNYTEEQKPTKPCYMFEEILTDLLEEPVNDQKLNNTKEKSDKLEEIEKKCIEINQRIKNISRVQFASSSIDDSSSITESETEKLSENDKGYSAETDEKFSQSKKRKTKVHTEIFGKATGVWKNKNFKDTPRLQNNLAGKERTVNTDDTDSSDIATRTDPKPLQNKETVKNCNLSANMDKPTLSTQEKILKLGLQDRRARFEETREVFQLPDVRLQPSVSDNEKMKQMQIQGNKYEIPDRKIPNINAKCVFSHVESPSEFYIHLDDEESKLIDSLNDCITNEFKRTKTPYKSKFEAIQGIGKFCFAYVKEEKLYYRVEVVNWLFDTADTKLVLVRLVDYGNVQVVHYKHLRELTKEYSLIPKIAVKCCLPMLYPPGSTKQNILTQWPYTSIEALRELSGLCQSIEKIYFKIFYVQEEGDVTGVDLYEIGNNEYNTVGQLLIDLGHAVQLVLSKDDPFGVLEDDEDIARFENCDNINEVVLGYDPKDEGRICKFTRPDGTCFKGRNCRLEHTKFTRGGYTTDQTLTYAGALNDIILPSESEGTHIRFTHIIGAAHYYVNIMRCAEALTNLEKIINDKRNCSSFEPYKIMPAYGEIVLVKHWTQRWLRAKVRHHFYDEEGNCTGVQVFMVDYGDIVDATMKNIGHIKPDYLQLPFQAIECILYNFKAKNNVNQHKLEKFFYENMVFREFEAKVMGVSDMALCLNVFYKDSNIGDILTEKGYLTAVNKQLFPSNTIVIPG